MLQTFKPLLYQSNYDLCLKAIGSLDGFVKFLRDNNILNSSVPPTNTVSFDNNNILSATTIGYNYATQNLQITSGFHRDEYGDEYD